MIKEFHVEYNEEDLKKAWEIIKASIDASTIIKIAVVRDIAEITDPTTLIVDGKYTGLVETRITTKEIVDEDNQVK